MSEKNSPNIDLVAEQLVARSASPIEEPSNVWPFVTWAIPAVAVVLALLLGIQKAHNPVDQIAQCLVLVPLGMLLVDAWGIGAGFIKHRSMNVLWMSLGLGIVHVLLWVWGNYLVQFDVFYLAEPTGPLSGVFVPRLGVVVLLSVMTLCALAGSLFLTWQTVILLGEDDIPVTQPETADEDPVEESSVFDAQALLTNLGYDVGGINGEMSQATLSAVKQFQAEAGLPTSGDVTAQTLNVLRSRDRVQSAPSMLQSVLLFVAHITQSVMQSVKDWWRRRS